MEDHRPITVMFLIDELDQWRGTETHLYRLLCHLDPARIRAVVATVGKAGLAQAFRQAAIPFYELNIYRVFHPAGMRGLAQIRNLIRKEDVRLLVSYHTASDLLAPVAARLSGIATLSCRRDEGFTKKPIHMRIQRYLDRMITGMISVSRAVAQAVERFEGYPVALNQVIWNGEDLDKFRPGHSSIRDDLNLTARAVVITCVGGLDPVKDHQTLLTAFHAIAPRYPQVYLLLVGRGSERERLEVMARPLGDRVRFLGHRSDVADILRASDIYVQTSTTEGFSNSILQAMATALPVVVTNVGGNPEFVRSDCGFLADPRQADQVAAGLERLVTDPELRCRMGRTARQWTEVHCSLDQMALAYMDAFEAAVEGQPLPSDTNAQYSGV